jgi:hypothetical protein
MKRSHWAVLMVSMTLAGSAVLAIGDATTQPVRHVKLPRDFTGLKDLTDDQKSQIIAIQAKYDEQIEELRKEQAADEKAVLTPDQVSELDAIAAKTKAERKAEMAEEKAQKARDAVGATTLPTTMP